MPLRITSYASARYSPRTTSYFVITCTARLTCLVITYAYAHAFITSSYTSNYLVRICQVANHQQTKYRISASPLLINLVFTYASPLRLRATSTALTTDQRRNPYNQTTDH
jgi:hypothetical protein